MVYRAAFLVKYTVAVAVVVICLKQHKKKQEVTIGRE